MGFFTSFKKLFESDSPKSIVPAVIQKLENTAPKTELANLDYHPKIMIAWGKAILGEAKFAEYLLDNGFEELYMATQAIYLKEEARDWLIANGYAHLMAMIHGGEGDEKALKWLKKYNFDLLFNIALAIDGDEEGFKWLNLNSTPDIFMLAKSIMHVKNNIEENHNNFHSFRKDA